MDSTMFCNGLYGPNINVIVGDNTDQTTNRTRASLSSSKSRSRRHRGKSQQMKPRSPIDVPRDIVFARGRSSDLIHQTAMRDFDCCRVATPSRVKCNESAALATLCQTYEAQFQWISVASAATINEESLVAEGGDQRYADNTVERLRILTSEASLQPQPNLYHQRLLQGKPKITPSKAALQKQNSGYPSNKHPENSFSSYTTNTTASITIPRTPSPSASREYSQMIAVQEGALSFDFEKPFLESEHNQLGENSLIAESSWGTARDHRSFATDESSIVTMATMEQETLLADAVLKEESILEELQSHFPMCKQGEAFWLQYSMIRDGASLHILLDKVRDTDFTLLALETMEGERMGAFCGCPWTLSQSFYGSGQSFLFRIPRDSTELKVFPFSFLNHNIQMCKPDRLVLGGGQSEHVDHSSCRQKIPKSRSISSNARFGGIGTGRDYGFGLWLEEDLLRGSSSPCITFNSPALSEIHADGSRFEIRNLEVWAITPCRSVEEAERNQREKRHW